MIISTVGNNFGADQVELKIFQNDNYIIVNGTLPFDRNTDEYKSADVLEIYVPDLTLKRSMETAVFVSYLTDEYGKCGTIVKSWIKNKNTICIEKYELSQYFTDFEFVFLCAYLPKGQRETFVVDSQIDLNITGFYDFMRSEVNCAAEHESWALLCIGFEGMSALPKETPFTLNLENFPTDIDVEIPIFGLMTYAQGWGAFWIPSRIKDGQLSCDGWTEAQNSQIGSAVLKAYIIRD